MSPEAQRIAIAESQGWKGPDHPDVKKHVATWSKPEIWYMKPNGLLTWLSDIPDYTNDLNAIHKAMESLSDTQIGIWLLRVSEICSRDCQAGKSRYSSANATASQRCEAFLKTLNLWEEE